MLNIPAEYWGTVAERRGEEHIACRKHGWSLDPSDTSVVCDDDGNYFCDQDCYEEWLQEQEDEEEAEVAVPAAG